MTPDAVIEAVKAVGPARPRRRRLSDRHEVAVRRQEVAEAEVHLLQRRRERAGHVQGSRADGAQSAPAVRGLPHRLLRDWREGRLHLHSRRVLPRAGSARGASWRRRARPASSARTSSAPGFDCEIYVHRGAGAYEAGEETALIESLEGKRAQPRLKPPFPGRRTASTAARRRSTTSRRSATCRSSSSTAPSGSRRSAPRRTAGRSSSASAATSRSPGVYEASMDVTLRELIYDPKFAGGIRGGHALKCVIPGGSSVPVLLPRPARHPGQLRRRRQGRLDARLGRHHRHGRDDVHGVGGARTCCTSTSTSRAASARRAAKAATGCTHARQDRARRGPDAATSICCCRSPTTSLGKTLCAFGDAAATPVLSTVKTFRAEYEAHIREGRCTVPAPWRARARAAHGWRRTDMSAGSSTPELIAPARRHRRHVLRAAELGGGARLHGAQGRGASCSSATARTWSGRRALLQPLADIVKLMFKEELRPKAADTFLFYLAPILSATAAFAAFAVVPFGADTTFFGLLDQPDSSGGRRRQRRAARDLRDHVDGRVRHRAGRLELEQQVLAARRPARRRRR